MIRLAETQMSAKQPDSVLINIVEQVNDASALGALGQIPLTFAPTYQHMHLHKVAISRDGKTLDRTQLVDIRFLQREAGLESGTYGGAVTAMLLLDDIRVGDTLQLVYSVDGDNPVFDGKYAQVVGWDRSEPVQLRRLWFFYPSTRKIAWRQLGDFDKTPIPVETSEHDGMRSLKFESHDLPGLDAEAYTPSDYLHYRLIEFSEYGSWNEVARWAATLFPPVDALPAEAQEQVDKWRTLPNKEAQAAAALRWVQDEIRYFSISLGESSHRPHAPEEVLRRRYGDCKDKTYLLITLLRALDIEARPILVDATAPDLPEKILPTSTAFDHVAVQARIEGKLYYLDGTRLGQRGSLHVHSPMLPRGAGLVADDATEALQALDKPIVAEQFATEMDESIVLPELKGEATLSVVTTMHGASAEYMRVGFQQLTAEQQQHALLARYERLYPGVRVLEGPTGEDDVMHNTYTLRAKLALPAPATERAGSWTMHFVPAPVAGTINLPQLIKRDAPLALINAPYVGHYHLSMTWPEVVSVHRDPSTEHVDDEFFQFTRRDAFRGNHEDIDMQFELVGQEVSAKDVPRLAADVKKLDKAISGYVFIAPDEVKHTGILGLGTETVGEHIRKQLEREVDGYGKTLAKGSLEGSDKAAALSSRSYANLCLGHLDDAWADAQAAIDADPATATAYASRGDVHMRRGEFELAIADYTKALTLGGDPSDLYFSRARTQVYAGHLDAAAKDLEKARKASKGEDLYPALWEAWILQRLGRPLPPDLAGQAKPVAQAQWPQPALSMLAGGITPEQMLAYLDNKHGDERDLDLAEANFYLGEYWLTQGDSAKARTAFDATRKSGTLTYMEYIASDFALRALDTTASAKPAGQ